MKAILAGLLVVVAIAFQLAAIQAPGDGASAPVVVRMAGDIGPGEKG